MYSIPNGTVLSSGYHVRYDDTLKVGDLCIAYKKGYHIITEIIDRPNAAPFVHTNCIYTDTFKKQNRKCQCDISYCKKITHETLDTMMKAFQGGIDKLRPLIKIPENNIKCKSCFMLNCNGECEIRE